MEEVCYRANEHLRFDTLDQADIARSFVVVNVHGFD